MPNKDPIAISPLGALSPDFAADAVFAIIQDAIPDSWDFKTLKNLLAREQAFGFLAMQNTMVIGFIAGTKLFEESEILSFGVLKKYQGQGIGERLLKHFLEESKAGGASKILLDVADDNVAAIGLYQKYNFTVFGVRERYYARGGQNRVNAILMALSLAK